MNAEYIRDSLIIEFNRAPYFLLLVLGLIQV